MSTRIFEYIELKATMKIHNKPFEQCEHFSNDVREPVFVAVKSYWDRHWHKPYLVGPFADSDQARAAVLAAIKESGYLVSVAGIRPHNIFHGICVEGFITVQNADLLLADCARMPSIPHHIFELAERGEQNVQR